MIAQTKKWTAILLLCTTLNANWFEKQIYFSPWCNVADDDYGVKICWSPRELRASLVHVDFKSELCGVPSSTAWDILSEPHPVDYWKWLISTRAFWECP